MEPTSSRLLQGRRLRYLLTLIVHRADRPLTVKELVTALEDGGFTVDGRPSKTVSDALRWEIGRGRVVRVGRGTYVRGHLPRSTAAFLRRHLRENHAA